MDGEAISDYSDLTAGQYEGEVMKRERNYTWRPYWCVLYGRQLTFYEDRQKRRVVGRIEIQPGSRCEKNQTRNRPPCLSELYHREYTKLKKYSLILKTKKGTHLFACVDVKEQTRWQIAMNNASQVDANGVRLSWVPTPFSMVSLSNKKEINGGSCVQSSVTRNTVLNNNIAPQDVSISMVPVYGVLPKRIPKPRYDDTRTLIRGSDSEVSDGLGFTNSSVRSQTKELVTSL